MYKGKNELAEQRQILLKSEPTDAVDETQNRKFIPAEVKSSHQ